MAGSARYEVNLLDNGQEDKVTLACDQDQLETDEIQSLSPPNTTTSDLRGSRSAGVHLPQTQSDRIVASLASEKIDGHVTVEHAHPEQEKTVETYEDRAKEYKTWAQIAIAGSVVFCYFPFSLICLVLAYQSSEETTNRNDEKDFISAKGCGVWTRVWSVAAIVWAALCGIAFIAFVAGVAS